MLAPPSSHPHNQTVRRRGPPPPDPAAAGRGCGAPGCAEPGTHRAPRSRDALHDYVWFCLAHVREYNAAWDYYKGMAPQEIEGHLRADTAWQRPTWPLGSLGSGRGLDPEALLDPLGILRDTPLHAARRRPLPAEPVRPPPELRAALDVMGLEWPTDGPTLRARWKELAKRFHPDANGGRRDAEEQLKDVNRAYSLLRARLGLASNAARQPAAAAAE